MMEQPFLDARIRSRVPFRTSVFLGYFLAEIGRCRNLASVILLLFAAHFFHMACSISPILVRALVASEYDLEP